MTISKLSNQKLKHLGEGGDTNLQSNFVIFILRDKNDNPLKDFSASAVFFSKCKMQT